MSYHFILGTSTPGLKCRYIVNTHYTYSCFYVVYTTLIYFIYAYTDFSQFVVGLEQTSFMVGEGDGNVRVCVEILATPASGNLECEIVAVLTTMDGVAGNS